MQCSPTRLFFDMTLWGSVPAVYENYKNSNYNMSAGKVPDCVLNTVPCNSQLMQAVLAFDENVVFWCDLILVYVLINVFIIVGVVCNVMNIAIFSTRKIITDSTNSLLLGLSVSDLLSLLVNSVQSVAFLLCFVDVAKALTMFNIIWVYSWHTFRFLNILSLELVATISLQRAAALVFPFKVSSMFSQRNTNIIIVSLILLFLASMILANVGFYPRWIYHHYFKQTISLGVFLRWDYTVMHDAVYTHLNVRSFISIFIIFVAASVTIYKLIRQAKNRSSLTASSTTKPSNPEKGKVMSAKETKVVKMSLTICLVTFVVYVAATLVNIIVQMTAEQIYGSVLPYITTYCSIILFAINSTVNFFLYMGMSTKFRVSFNELILCRQVV